MGKATRDYGVMATEREGERKGGRQGGREGGRWRRKGGREEEGREGGGREGGREGEEGGRRETEQRPVMEWGGTVVLHVRADVTYPEGPLEFGVW